MTEGPGGKDEILLKRSGRRARLDVTADDLEVPTRSLPAVTRPAPSATSKHRAARPAHSSVELRRPRPLPGAGGPPDGGTPVRYVHDQPSPWWKSRGATWAAAGLLALAVVAVVSVFLIAGGRDPADEAYAQLSSSGTTVVSVTREASEATRLAAVRKAGRTAGQALGELDTPEAELRQLDDARYGPPALELVRAERAYLDALGDLRLVNLEMVSERSLAGWRSIRRKIANRQAQVVEASEAIALQSFPQDTAKIALSATELSGPLGALSATITKAHAEVQAYRRRVRDWRAAVGRARGREGEIVQYRNSVQGALTAYSSDRKKVDGFVERADAITPGDSAARAQSDVDNFYADRQRTIDQLSNALDAAPQSVRTAHQNLEAPLRESLRGLDALRQAVSEYETDPFGTTYTSVKQTPSWSEFEDASASATSDYQAASAQWNTAVLSAIKDVKDRGGIPPRPKRPVL